MNITSAHSQDNNCSHEETYFASFVPDIFALSSSIRIEIVFTLSILRNKNPGLCLSQYNLLFSEKQRKCQYIPIQSCMRCKLHQSIMMKRQSTIYMSRLTSSKPIPRSMLESIRRQNVPKRPMLMYAL